MTEDQETFPQIVLDELAHTCNVLSHIAHSFAIGVTDRAVTFVTQTWEGAMVVHLLPDGTQDVTIVGKPDLTTRVNISQLLTHLGHRWEHIGFYSEGARAASVACYDGAA